MATTRSFTSGHFELAIEGHSTAVFTELAGITSEVQPVPYSTGGPLTLTLQRSKTNDTQLAAWHRSRMRKNGTLTIHGAAGAPVRRYRLTNATATECQTVAKIDGFAIKQQIAPTTEKVTISVERIERVR